MTYWLLNRELCPECGDRRDIHLSRTIQVNGNVLVFWFCHSCRIRVGSNIPHYIVEQHLRDLSLSKVPRARYAPKSLDELPLVIDYRDSEPCVICGYQGGTEYHHFLPKKFKTDPRVSPFWKQWDACGCRLCQEHHRLWHDLVCPLDFLAQITIGKIT